MILSYTYLSKECQISAVVIKIIITHPDNRGTSQVYGIQGNANNGENRSNYVHKSVEAHLSDKIYSIKTSVPIGFESFFFSVLVLESTHQAKRRKPARKK